MSRDPASAHPTILAGRAAAAREPLVLRAGPVTALLDGADLRHVRLGDTELVQRVYVALRDAPWNTIPAEFSNWQVDVSPDRFRVAFDAHHLHEAIDFTWCGVIEGGPDGTIRYELDGTCHGVFQYSKIGFNVHHALDGAIGRPYRAQAERGELRGTLPSAIDPQRVVGGKLSGMFDPYREIAIEVAPGLEAVVGLEGDLLELQDHRNWADGNFKSYATPLALGFPFDSEDGRRIRQVLTIGFQGAGPARLPDEPTTIDVGGEVGPLPAIGFGQPSHGDPLSPREASRLVELHPAHLRVDLVAKDPEAAAILERAAADARAVGAALELAVHASDTSGAALAGVAGRLRALEVRVSRVLVYFLAEGYSAVAGLTPASVVRLVREHLEPVTGSVPFAGGTNQAFSDVNRDRPSDPALTGLCFPVCPTVHAADDASIVENLVGVSEVVVMARSFAGGRPISVSPVTIATRFGPYPGGPSAPDALPAAVDVRQASLLGAAWTAGCIRHLAISGADSVTFYETSGWRGIVERDGGPPDARFPSQPGAVFPMYHVFRDVAEWRDGAVLATRSNRPLVAEALAVRDASGLHVLVANLAPAPQRVVVAGLGDGPASCRILDAGSAGPAMANPDAFRATRKSLAATGGRLALELGPYAVARVDAAR